MMLENEHNNVKRNTRSRVTNPTPYSGLGKLPPQAVDLEEAILGALMLEKDALETVADILKPEIFYRDNHQRIYNAITRLLKNSSPVDILTVTAELRQGGELEMVGGAYYITELTNRVASAANIEYHSRIVLQKYTQRELIRISQETLNAAYEDTTDIFTLMSSDSLEKDKLLTGLINRKEVNNSILFNQAITELAKAGQTSSHVTGVPSGFKEIDANTAGWQKSDLIIVAGRPGMGKTSFVLQCACNAAIDHGKPVAFFSLEMSAVQLMHKEISIVTGVPFWKIKKKALDGEDWSRVNDYVPTFESAPVQWDDTPALNIFEFRAKCRRLKSKHDIQLIIIDYLQLIQAENENKQSNREQNIGFISRQLKATAKELNVPVIALSQLSRKVEERPGGGKRPMLSDLRESGSIEQDADLVFFIYRPEYYGIEFDENNNSTAGLAEIILAKHRNGDTADFCLKFDKSTTGFADDVIEWNDSPVVMPPPVDNSSNNNFQPFIIRPSDNFDIPTEGNNDDDEPPF